ncbi:MAG: ADP-ribosylglycohydrolase family protein, partial [Thermoplasmata archaeon]|nr:ADP-ribosylglycohydrolase family protein [Thermoplasmata archaeon]
MSKNDPANHYADIVKGTGAISPQYRGSGTKTAVLAVALAWIYKHSPKEAIEAAANLLGSDTDTIATMS